MTAVIALRRRRLWLEVFAAAVMSAPLRAQPTSQTERYFCRFEGGVSSLPNSQGGYSDGPFELWEGQRSFWLTLMPINRTPQERHACAKAGRRSWTMTKTLATPK
jgi:hypothetical protein